MLLPIAVLIVIMFLGIYHITTTLISISNKPISQETKDLNNYIESYVHACYLAKTSKNLTSCKIHLDDIENQCKTNVNYSQVIACKDPRLAQMVNEQSQLFTNPQWRFGVVLLHVNLFIQFLPLLLTVRAQLVIVLSRSSKN